MTFVQPKSSLQSRRTCFNVNQYTANHNLLGTAGGARTDPPTSDRLLHISNNTNRPQTRVLGARKSNVRTIGTTITQVRECGKSFGTGVPAEVGGSVQGLPSLCLCGFVLTGGTQGPRSSLALGSLRMTLVQGRVKVGPCR